MEEKLRTTILSTSSTLDDAMTITFTRKALPPSLR